MKGHKNYFLNNTFSETFILRLEYKAEIIFNYYFKYNLHAENNNAFIFCSNDKVTFSSFIQSYLKYDLYKNISGYIMIFFI